MSDPFETHADPGDDGGDSPEAVVHRQRLQIAVLSERVELMHEQVREFRRATESVREISAQIDALSRADRRVRLFGVSWGTVAVSTLFSMLGGYLVARVLM